MTNVEKVEAAEEAIRQTGKDAHDQMIAERLRRTKTASLPRTPPKAMAVCK